MNAISLSLFNEAFAQQITYRGCNIIGTATRVPIVIEKLLFDVELTVYNDMSTIINPSLTNLVLGEPFVRKTRVALDEKDGTTSFTNGMRKVIFRNGQEEIYEYQPSGSFEAWGLQGRRPGKIKRGNPDNLKIPCMIGRKYFDNIYLDTSLPMNVMSLFHYNDICRQGMADEGKNDVGIDDEVHILVGNMMFTTSFKIVSNIEDYIDPRLSQVVLGVSFCNAAHLVIDETNGVMTFTDGIRTISYQTPYKIWDLKETNPMELDGLRSQLILCDDEVRRGCENIFDLSDGFFKEVDKLGPKYRNNLFNLEDPKYLNYKDNNAHIRDETENIPDDEVT